ncbi:MAG: DUF6226 family protein [Mobilicoccus sp.]|nr:DUF6226 family protein [Mobilicoccus sp.]
MRRRVEELYALSVPRSWPNPHPDAIMPAEEEYSRVTDPARLRIALLRAAAWADALSEVPGVEVRRLRPEECPSFHLPVDGWLVRRDREGTVPLLLVTFDADDAFLLREQSTPGVLVCVGTADVVIQGDDCACDACDFGSESVIVGLDDTIVDLVTGPVAALRHAKFAATMTTGSASSSSSGATSLVPLGELQEMCRTLLHGEPVSLPEGTTVVVGAPWGVIGAG